MYNEHNTVAIQTHITYKTLQDRLKVILDQLIYHVTIGDVVIRNHNVIINLFNIYYRMFIIYIVRKNGCQGYSMRGSDVRVT